MSASVHECLLYFSMIVLDCPRMLPCAPDDPVNRQIGFSVRLRAGKATAEEIV